MSVNIGEQRCACNMQPCRLKRKRCAVHAFCPPFSKGEIEARDAVLPVYRKLPECLDTANSIILTDFFVCQPSTTIRAAGQTQHRYSSVSVT